jgi:hypothetical protein
MMLHTFVVMAALLGAADSPQPPPDAITLGSVPEKVTLSVPIPEKIKLRVPIPEKIKLRVPIPEKIKLRVPIPEKIRLPLLIA